MVILGPGILISPRGSKERGPKIVVNPPPGLPVLGNTQTTDPRKKEHPSTGEVLLPLSGFGEGWKLTNQLHLNPMLGNFLNPLAWNFSTYPPKKIRAIEISPRDIENPRVFLGALVSLGWAPGSPSSGRSSAPSAPCCPGSASPPPSNTAPCPERRRQAEKSNRRRMFFLFSFFFCFAGFFYYYFFRGLKAAAAEESNGRRDAFSGLISTDPGVPRRKKDEPPHIKHGVDLDSLKGHQFSPWLTFPMRLMYHLFCRKRVHPSMPEHCQGTSTSV